MVDYCEQLEKKLENQGLSELFKWNFDISLASDQDIKDIIEDQDSKLFHIHIKVQPDGHWVKPADYLESIDAEYTQMFKNERLKKKNWRNNISESERKELEEKWEEWRIYFLENRERREDWETEMNDKYEKLCKQKKESEIKKMKWIRYREIEKYKEYPTVYNKLLRVMDHSKDIYDIDLVVMEKSEKYGLEKIKKNVNDWVTEILLNESNIEEIRQYRNKTMESTKENILYALSQIQEEWNTLINEIWENRDSIEEIVQIFDKMINSIPQNISNNTNKKIDRIKFIYRREWSSWYKYNDTVDFLKREWKQIIEC